MAITKVQYTDNKKDVVHIVYNNDNSVKITTLVDNTENTDWINVLAWVADGNTIEEAD
jgi:single-stranded DNA-binding protein|tara:strand:+ start:931 stop:1104 length:174 start_codon:yes stop_codon:yes gene_type:complete